jgi:hypothetical protein
LQSLRREKEVGGEPILAGPLGRPRDSKATPRVADGCKGSTHLGSGVLIWLLPLNPHKVHRLGGRLRPLATRFFSGVFSSGWKIAAPVHGRVLGFSERARAPAGVERGPQLVWNKAPE